MKTKQKENALNEFIDMIEHSWTYDRMTDNEREQCLETFHSNRTTDALKGTWEARWTILNAVYGAFLDGIGYDGPSWREKESAEPVPTF